MENWATITDHVFWRIIEASAGAALLAACVALAGRTARHHLSPRHTYVLWFLVVGALLVPGALKWPLAIRTATHSSMKMPVREIAPTPPSAESFYPATESRGRVGVPALVPPPNSAPPSVAVEPGVIHGQKFQLAESAAPVSPVLSFGKLKARWDRAIQWTFRALPTLWLTGVLLQAGRALILRLLWHHEVATCPRIGEGRVHDALVAAAQTLRLSRLPLLRVTDRLQAPAITGLFRPSVLLPRAIADSADDTVLQYIFLHELAHLKRGDHIVNALLRAILVVHWFNPMLYLARREIRVCQEHLCDARVIAALGANHASGYGHTLLDLFQSSRGGRAPSAVLSMLSGKSQLTRRIDMISNGSLIRRGISWPALALFLALSPLAALNLSFAAQQTLTEVPLDKPLPAPVTTQESGAVEAPLTTQEDVDIPASPVAELSEQPLSLQVDVETTNLFREADRTGAVPYGTAVKEETVEQSLPKKQPSLEAQPGRSELPALVPGDVPQPIEIQAVEATSYLPVTISHPIPVETFTPDYANVRLQTGDSIKIEVVGGDCDSLKEGGAYRVQGTYTLDSQPEAVLGLFATNGHVAGYNSTTVQRGASKSFVLTGKLAKEGDLHVSFYPVGGGEALGGVYFRNAATVKPKAQTYANSESDSREIEPQVQADPQPRMKIREVTLQAEADPQSGLKPRDMKTEEIELPVAQIVEKRGIGGILEPRIPMTVTLDPQQSGPQLVQGTIYVLSAGMAGLSGKELPERFASLLPELNELGSGTDPMLLDSAKFRTRVGEGFSIMSHLPDTEAGSPQQYMLKTDNIQLGTDGTIRLQDVQFQTDLQDKGQSRPIELTISPDVKSGELTLLGSASVRGAGQALVLVVEITPVS